MHSNKQVSIHGNIKDLFFQLRYNSRPLLSGYLSEFIGLISGVKNIAALETSDPYLAKKLLDMLHTLDPTKKFCSLTTKGYHWIKKHNVDYKYNVFIGQRGENLKQFDKYYKSPKEYCDEVGEGLSYPICCTRASWINKSYTDFFQIDKVNEIDYRINNFYNRGGSNLSIIRHYVCNYNCQESIDYAQRVLLFVEKRFPELHSQYNKILKMPLLILYKDKSPHRTVGDSVSFSFNGHYENETLLKYKTVYYHADTPNSQFINTKQGNVVLQKLVEGNIIKITPKGAVIYNNNKPLTRIIKKDLVFINPT